MRPQHTLKDNKSTSWPERYIFFDTETTEKKIDKDTIEAVLNIGVAKFVRFRKSQSTPTIETLKFTTADKFWDFVISKSHPRTRLVLIAHNIQFDMSVLNGFHSLNERGFQTDKFILNNKVCVWKFNKKQENPNNPYIFNKSTGELTQKQDNLNITILDNMNYFSSSLADLGASLNFAKGDFKTASKDIDSLWIYCERDVDIMIRAWSVWRDFIISNELGSYAVTLAGQALNAFRHRFMPAPIQIHDNDPALKLERIGYFGGRTEAYQLGPINKGKINYYDINSLYPYVMANRSYPVNLLGHYKSNTLADLKRDLKTKLAMAEVFIDTTYPDFPLRINGRLCFPVGQFWSVLCGDELNRAIANDNIKAVGAVNLYESAPLFAEYVNFFYSQRLAFRAAGNTDFAYICKLLLNTLYGKWGQQIDDYEPIEGVKAENWSKWSEWDADEQRWYSYRCLDRDVEISKGKIEGYNSFPAISAFVTSNARSHLLDLIYKIGRPNVLYTDTDSVFVQGEKLESRYPDLIGNDLGQLKLVKSSKNVTISGVKDYVFGNETHIKGIKKGARKRSDGTYRITQFRNLTGAMRQSDVGRVLISQKTKTLHREYHKGRVLPDKSVLPFICYESL